MGILFTITLGILFTIVLGILFTIVLGIQFTISKRKNVGLEANPNAATHSSSVIARRSRSNLGFGRKIP